MSEFSFTERFLALVIPCFPMTNLVMVQLTFEWKVSFAYLAFELPIHVSVLMQGESPGSTKELLALLAL